MFSLMNKDIGLPSNLSNIVCKNLILKPLDLEDIMNKFYETPWNYDSAYLLDSMLFETFEIFEAYWSMEFGQWRYYFIFNDSFNGEAIVAKLWAQNETLDMQLELISDLFLHPFQYPLPVDEKVEDHADHFEFMLHEVNKRITEWNSIVSQRKPIIYTRPNLKIFKEDLLDSFFEKSVMNEWNFGCGFDFESFNDFSNDSLFSHHHLGDGVDGVEIDFDPFVLQVQTHVFENSSVIIIYLEMKNVRIRLVPFIFGYNYRDLWSIGDNSLPNLFQSWIDELTDSIIQWNQILLRKGDRYGYNSKPKNRLTN